MLKRRVLDLPSKRELLTNTIKDALVSGEFKPGDRLPSENELSEMYGLSRMTVREALGALGHEGLVVRMQGKGTYVAEPKKENQVFALVLPHLYPEESYLHRYDLAHLTPIAQYAQEEARLNGANTLLYLANDDVDIERENLLDILSGKPDGAIIYYIGEDRNKDVLQSIINAGIPVVLIDRYYDGLECDSVTTDNYSGAYGATRIIFERGFERVLHFTLGEHASSTVARGRGYSAAVEKQGCRPSVHAIGRVYPVAEQERLSYEMALAVLKETDLPFGVFTVNAPMLSGVLRAVEELGLEHGKVGLACFDDPTLQASYGTLLVKVIQPLEEIARESVRILKDRIEGRHDVRCLLLAPDIQVVSPDTAALCSSGR